MKIIILAGGGGTRLFPLSRTCFPKQFMKIRDGKSFLGNTVKRFLSMVSASDVIIVTNSEYVYHVENELEECDAKGAHIVMEPAGRNTAPAIALAVKFCKDNLGCSDDEVLFVAPADHVIESGEAFIDCVNKATSLAMDNNLVTFGIVPQKAETGYGYIEVGAGNDGCYVVEAFKEKPELSVAERYVSAGNYYWNSGMFVFTAEFMVSEFKKYQPQIAKQMELSYDDMTAKFSEMPNVSIDYAVAEHSKAVKMVSLDCYWNDIGSWDAMYDILPKDKSGNALHGDCMAVDCQNSLFMGRDRLIAGIGLDDVLLVETDDVIVVAKKGESQKVKNVVEELKKRGRREASEHTTIYRPWGSTTLLGEGLRYKMKKVRIKPGCEIGLQMHYHRSEHWIVISGTAEVRLGDSYNMIHENESVFIPQTTKHSLKNPGKIPLEIIEVQNGSYIGEDDIVRFDNKE